MLPRSDHAIRSKCLLDAGSVDKTGSGKPPMAEAIEDRLSMAAAQLMRQAIGTTLRAALGDFPRQDLSRKNTGLRPVLPFSDPLPGGNGQAGLDDGLG